MRRAICYCEPSYARAGEIRNFNFICKVSEDLPKGCKLKFDLLSQERAMDWEIPSTNTKSKSNVIWAEIPSNKTIKAVAVKNENSTQFEFTLPNKLATGEFFIIHMGTMDGDPQKKGNRAQTYTQRKREFILYIDPKGKSEYKESEHFHLDIKGNTLDKLKVITPSIVSRNRRFDIMVRFEDEYGNLTNFAPEDTLIDLTYENLRESLNWKLFVPETGFLTLPNLYFNEPGIYKIKLVNLATKEIFYSDPIKCFPDTDLSIFWGILHGESTKFDSQENIESCLRFFRDDKNMHFYATSCFDSLEETSNDHWKLISNQIAEFNEDERFLTFLGSFWLGNLNEEGLRQFLFSKDHKHLLRKKDLKNNSLKKIYKTVASKDLISIPTFTMANISTYDFNDFNEEFERVVEIYNAWGSSECTEKEGNLFPIKGNRAKENPAGSIRKALNHGHRFGFVAGGLDDRGIFSSFYDSTQIQYTPGITAIIAKDQNKEAIYHAIQKRACYATTGKRIVIDFKIANQPIGSELSTATKPGLCFNRYITGFIVGTTLLKKVEIIRNGSVFKSFTPTEAQYEFVLDDTEKLEDVALKDKNGSLFIYYYLRVVQKDGHTAWTSPIWIDLQDKIKLKKKK